MSVSPASSRSEFVKIFNGIARHRHRYEVFRDFVTLSAIEMHNALWKVPSLESEYIGIVKRYSKEEYDELCKLLAHLIMLLEPEPRDILGSLYMELDLGSSHVGQFFTPSEVSELMAMLTYGDSLRQIQGEFVTVSEPACGAGGMVLAFAKVMISHGHNPSERLWVQCQDIDRVAALMCYLQLALWNIPGVVIVGNTLALEAREVFYTPAHHLGFWTSKLRRRDEQEVVQMPLAESEKAIINPSNIDTSRSVCMEPEYAQVSLSTSDNRGQLDFGF